ncbi:growth-regulating factor 7-like [Tasmannia lanceolata]|uniref:growth-regulating factor 7-like n=1 Tax=Tasmannia lanceolata TaxID=3420 RepID=UPI004063B7CF
MMTSESEKKKNNREGEIDGLGLGLVPQKMARTDILPFRMVPHPFSPGYENITGPTFYNGSEIRSNDLYFYDVAAKTQQPFSNTSSAFKSPGVGMVRFPFTSAQYQELERQAWIYKCMMASVPVPPDLLIPINSSSASHSNLGRSGFNLRFSNSVDPEPGRCRRTDGKKWRCSRDVAPDQKYCERHMHRGRPRSRKPVEVQTQNTTTRPISTPVVSDINTTSSHVGAKPYHHQPSVIFPKPVDKIPYQTMDSRYLDWMKGGTEHMGSSQQWQLMNSKLGLKTNVGAPVLQHYEEHLNLNFSDFGSGGSNTQQNNQSCLFLNTDLSSLEDPGSNHREQPRRFIDAWSNDNNNKSSNSSGGELPVSSLTLSMPSGEDMNQIQMGLGITDSEHYNVGLKPQPLSWMNPVPWLTGGPLGEVLQSSTGAGSNSASPHGGCSSNKSSCGGLNLMSDGWVEGPSPRESPPRPVSSPTGVLQKTLASFSDSSSGNSPTFAAAKSEIALQWLNNQSKLPSENMN